MSSGIENKILSYLATSGWVTSKEICENTGLKMGSVSSMIVKIEGDNAIVSKPNPAVQNGKLYKINGVKSGFMADFNRLLSRARGGNAATS